MIFPAGLSRLCWAQLPLFPAACAALVVKSSNLAPTYRVLKRFAYALGSPIFHLWWAQVEHRITLQRTAYLNASRVRSALFYFDPRRLRGFGGKILEPRSNVPRT